MAQAKRFLIAPSCFKEGLTAREVAEAIARGLRQAAPDAQLTLLPLSDGGEGFARLLGDAVGSELRTVTVPGPRGEPTRAPLALFGESSSRTAALDIASVAGLRLIPPEARDPTRVSSQGVGYLIRAALSAGAHRLIVGCGDSGTSDGGAGMARALGVRFLDSAGKPFDPLPSELSRLHHIDIKGLERALESVPIEVACSLHVPLTGPLGTARVYGPQKGASPSAVTVLERALDRLAEVLQRDLGVNVTELPGGGAAGGLGAGLCAFLGARLVNRYDLIFRYIPFEQELARADLVVTGEGALDRRTLLGKIPAEIVRRARTANVPVVAIVGQVGEGADEVLAFGLNAYIPIVQGPCSLQEAMERASELVEQAAERLVRLAAVGARLENSPDA